jgi:hypothetical protein
VAPTKTKAIMALGVLDIARQVSHAWAAKQRAQEERIGFGAGLREDTRQVLRDARGRIPTAPKVEWGMPPRLYRPPSLADRLRTWGPIGVVIVASAAAVMYVAHVIAQRDPELDPDKAATDSKMVGAVRAGSHAIDAGMDKVVEGGSAAAVGTASAVAAGSTAVRQATVKRAKVELVQRVVRPAKHKAIVYGSLGVLGLTVYVIIIAVIVQLVVGAIG